MNAKRFPWLGFDSPPQRCRVVGVAGLMVCLAGVFFDAPQFYRSYLVAYLFAIGFPLGCLALLMLHHLVGGNWGFVVQRLLEAGVRTLPLMALLFLPIAAGAHDLYLWARPDAVAADPLLQQKGMYLNLPFFYARAVLYFAVWIVLGQLLSQWSVEQDRSGDANLTRRLQNLSGPGLVLYGLTVTFAMIDWAMSLEPHWYSTVYGLAFVVGNGLAALALVICVAAALVEQGPLARVAGADHFHDLGNLLLAFVMLWAYLGFSQFMIIWMENLKEEIPWYLHRTMGGWQVVALALVAFQFALPFVLLLARAAKRRPQFLAGIAVVVLIMRWVDLFWLIAPAFQPQGFYFHWLDLAALGGIAGIWAATFLGYVDAHSLVPLRDPRFAPAAHQAQRG
jgi:hypothetical protein